MGQNLNINNMQKYKSIAQFRRQQDQARQRRRSAMLFAIAYPDKVMGKKYRDENDLRDVYEDQGITPLAPISPAEVAPIGMLDGMYPKSDLDGKGPENLYYGILETHMADDGETSSNKIVKTVNPDGDVEYRLNGKLHNDKDQPAVIHANGDQFWYQHGQRHREGDQPAVIFANGTQHWYQHGQPHREGDQPAIISANGDQYWYQHDQRHREGDQPAVIFANGEKEYWVKGKRHREEGPAVHKKDGAVEYWYHGKQKPEIRIERVKLWNGTFPCIIDWTDTVLRKQQDPDTQDSSIWVYDQHYNPLYIPKLEDIQKGASAATLGEINEGLPDPSTGKEEPASKTKNDKHSLVFYRNFDYAKTRG